MGIVVCVAMLLGLVQLLTQQPLMRKAIAGLLLALGLWNALWYGLQHSTEFWGLAALFSGVSMVSAGLLIGADKQALGRSWRWIIIISLAISFLLYAVSLVRLNLGLAIIR